MKKITKIFIVLPVGIGLAGIVVGAYFLDPTFITDFYRLTSMIVAALWAFFILPSVLLAVAMGKRYFSGKSPQEAFRAGVFIGVLGFGGLFALCLLISPVAGTMWYVFTFREIAAERRERKFREESSQNEDPFEF